MHQPRNFGNISIIPITLDQSMDPDTYKAILIDRDGESFLHLYFDKQDMLHKFTYLDGEESLFKVDLPGGSAEYGYAMDPLYKDIDRNGAFDIQWTKGKPCIIVDDDRIEVLRFNYAQDGAIPNEAIVKEDNEDVLYVFKTNKGWVKQKK